METTLLPNSPVRQNYHIGLKEEGYYSAELPITGLETRYHSRIWKDPSWQMSVLVREDSAILPFLNVGDIMSVKYYHANCRNEPDCLETAIREIRKSSQGPFRGHYRVELEILSEATKTNRCAQ